MLAFCFPIYLFVKSSVIHYNFKYVENPNIYENLGKTEKKPRGFSKKIENFLNGKIRAAPLAAATHICTNSELLPLLYPRREAGILWIHHRRRPRPQRFLVSDLQSTFLSGFLSYLAGGLIW